MLLHGFNPSTGAQFTCAAAKSFFIERTNQSDEGFPDSPDLCRSVGEPTWFSDIVCPVSLYILFLVNTFWQSKCLFLRRNKATAAVQDGKIKLGLTDIVGLKATFSEEGF